MKIQTLDCLDGAKRARGLTVIIDVFRAFSVECYMTAKGAEEIVPIGDLEEAFRRKRENPENTVLFGERGGAKVEGCDFGNSPFQMREADFSGKIMLHTTSAGTQGIVGASGADEILGGSLLNARAIAKYIREQDPEEVSLVAMGDSGRVPTPEDRLCARYIESLLADEPLEMEEEILRLRYHGGEKFFRQETQEIFPREDFALCTDYDRFPFLLKVEREKREDGSDAFVIRPRQRFIALPHRITCKDEYGRILAEILFPEKEPGLYDIESTYVAESLLSPTLAGELVREASEMIKRKGGRITASDPFAKGWLTKYGETGR